MAIGAKRAVLWPMALIVGPALGIVATIPATGLGSDILAWTLLLGVPPAVSLLAGLALSLSFVEVVIAAALATIVSVLGLLLLLWYALSVGGLT